MYAICGQHDLPHHDLGAVRRSAYWTLVEAGKLAHLKPGRPVQLEAGGRPLRLHGFPWGVPVQPLKRPHDLTIEVAVVHAYLWKQGKGYPNAPEMQRVMHVKHDLAGFDVAVYGDNHTPFAATGYKGRGIVYNCGSFLRRKADEVGHRPSVGLLRADNTVERHYLDVSEDKFVDAEELVQGCLTGAELLDLVEELGGLQHKPADFRDAVLRAAGKLPPGVRAAVHKALEEADR